MLHTDRPSAEKIEPMLTITEVARLLNVHVNTLRRWSDRGLIRTYRIGPRADRRFREDDITCFLSQLKGKSTGD
jgi:excisionase family DNA binding protein